MKDRAFWTWSRNTPLSVCCHYSRRTWKLKRVAFILVHPVSSTSQFFMTQSLLFLVLMRTSINLVWQAVGCSAEMICTLYTRGPKHLAGATGGDD